jgi:hypothetical protein
MNSVTFQILQRISEYEPTFIPKLYALKRIESQTSNATFLRKIRKLEEIVQQFENKWSGGSRVAPLPTMVRRQEGGSRSSPSLIISTSPLEAAGTTSDRINQVTDWFWTRICC